MPESLAPERGVEQRAQRLGYPEAWLLLVALPALACGATLGRLYAPGEDMPVQLVFGVTAGASLALGVVGGLMFARVGQLAAMGAAMWASVLTISLGISLYAGRIPEDEVGGMGMVIGVVFVVSFGPMLAGAAFGSQVRRAPVTTLLTTLVAGVGMAAVFFSLLWLLGYL